MKLNHKLSEKESEIVDEKQKEAEKEARQKRNLIITRVLVVFGLIVIGGIVLLFMLQVYQNPNKKISQKLDIELWGDSEDAALHYGTEENIDTNQADESDPAVSESDSQTKDKSDEQSQSEDKPGGQSQPEDKPDGQSQSEDKSGGSDSPEKTNTDHAKNRVTMADKTTEGDTKVLKQFYYENLTDEVKDIITGVSYPEDDSNAKISYDDLRYVHVLHYDFNDQVCEGEIICNQAVADDMIDIFYQLYEAKYQIEKIRLVDEYNADDEASMEDNNSSCFNYRVIVGTNKISNHSYGAAIDINPLYNPYIPNREGVAAVQPSNAEAYTDRTADFAHKIDHDDLAYQLFTQHGFTWGGDWNGSKDYQHFEKKL